MAHAPFSHSDSRFNLTQHLSADLTDSLAKLCDGGWGVPVQHLCEILPEQLRIQSAPGLDAVGDAGCSGLPEGSSDAEIIILGKLRSVHAVADVTGMVPPVFHCLLPEMGLTEAERRPLGKYGIMRQQYLEQNRPGLYTRLILSGKLMEHLQEIDTMAHSRLESLMSLLTKQAGVTEELKARDQMKWVGTMNALKNQAEEMILTELIYA